MKLMHLGRATGLKEGKRRPQRKRRGFLLQKKPTDRSGLVKAEGRTIFRVGKGRKNDQSYLSKSKKGS